MVITDASGTTYHFPAVPIGTVNTFLTPFASPETVLPDIITDRNGNQLTLTNVGQDEAGYKDSLGRTVVSWNLGTGASTVSVSGLGDVSVASTTSSGDLVFPGTITDVVDTNQPCVKDTTQPFSTTYTAQSVISFPNGDKYTLSFDSGFGQISKVVYPDGGYIVYTWGPTSDPGSAPVNIGLARYEFTNNNVVTTLSCTYEYQTPAVIARDVYNGGQRVLHQTFAYTTTTASGQWTSRETLVTTQDLITNQTTYTDYNYEPIAADNENTSAVFGPDVPVETNVKYENSSRTVLKEVHKTWGDARHVIGEQAILYDPEGANAQGSARQYCYDTNEQLIGLYEYDYQSQGSKTADPACYTYAFTHGSNSFGTDPGLVNTLIGPMVRNTATAMHSFASAHIVNEASSVTVYTGAMQTSQNIAAQTSVGYDQSTVSSPPVATTLYLVNPPGGDRGNATTITRVGNVGPSATSTYGYYTTGQLAWKVDPCGNTTCPDMPGSGTFRTTYVYTDPGGWDPYGNSDAYLTSITDPLGHMRSFSYDYSSGKLTSSTDEYLPGGTGNTTTYIYNTEAQQCSTTDGLDRLTEIDYPGGGVTSYCYNDSVPKHHHEPTVERLHVEDEHKHNGRLWACDRDPAYIGPWWSGLYADQLRWPGANLPDVEPKSLRSDECIELQW